MAFSQPVTAISNALLGFGASGLNRYHNSICCWRSAQLGCRQWRRTLNSRGQVAGVNTVSCRRLCGGTLRIGIESLRPLIQAD